MPPGKEPFTPLSLEELDRLKGKVSDLVYLNAVYASVPSIWMENNLRGPYTDDPFILRSYQREIINNHASKKILRIGRQAGKTLSLTANAIWRACCFPGSKIAIVTPREAQMKNIISMMKNFIAKSDSSVKQLFISASSQPVEFRFTNSSTIRFFTVAKESMSAGGSTIRGQSVSDLYVDECDLIDDQTMEEAIIPTMNDYTQATVWLSSTPTGRVGFFHKEWHSGEYAKWHFPSSVNPNWTAEKEARIQRLDRATREHEYLANWYTGETSVFRSDLIDVAEKVHSKLIDDNGKLRPYSYQDRDVLIARAKYRLIGIDWNKTQGTRIVGVTIDQTGKICIVFKERIEFTQFQQHEAINRIRALDRWFCPDYIAVDRGYGEMQIEQLRLISVREKTNMIGHKILPVETGGTLEITDIFTNEKHKTYVKNFMVKSAVRCLEQGLITFPVEEYMSNDKKKADTKDLSMSDQMKNYYIEKVSYDGREKYACRSDHDLDAFMFAIYAYITEILKQTNLYDMLPITHATITHAPNMPVDQLKRQTMQQDSNIAMSMPHPRSLKTAKQSFTTKRSIRSRSLMGSSRRSRSLYG